MAWHDDDDDDIVRGKIPCGVVANVLGCDIIVSKFNFQSHHSIHFQTPPPPGKYELPYFFSYRLYRTWYKVNNPKVGL